MCKECGGSGICPHGKNNKYACKDCLLMRRSTTEAQASHTASRCFTSGDTADRVGALDRDALLDESPGSWSCGCGWVHGLECIGDAEHVVALLVQRDMSLANLGWFTVELEELAATASARLRLASFCRNSSAAARYNR